MVTPPLRFIRCRRRLLAGLFLLALLIVRSGPVQAQSSEREAFTMVLRGVPLEQALEELVAATQINLVYDTRLMREVRVFCTAREAPAEALLHCILRDAGLDFYRTSAGTYVLTEAIRHPPRYGRLVGVVVDQASGEPLSEANVLLADAGVGTASNEAGLFSFSDLISGAHRVVVTHVGYEAAVDSVWVPSGTSVRRRIALRARSIATEPVVINGLQQRLPSRGLGQGLLTKEHLEVPSSAGTADVARGTSSLLGVTLQEPMAELHIQGGDPGEHQMQLDGTPIRNPVTLGHLLGAFSPLAIERLTVHKAGFGADHGSLVSGIVAAEHALSSGPDQHVAIEADPLSVNGRVQGHLKLPGGVQTTLMAAARTSLWRLYRDPTLDHLLQRWHAADPLLLADRLGTAADHAASAADRRPAEVAFSDVHAAARLRLSPFHTLQASLYRGRNMVDSEFIVPETSEESSSSPGRLLLARDRYHWTNWAGQLRHQWLLGARALGRLRLYGSRQSLGHGYQMRLSEEPPVLLEVPTAAQPYEQRPASDASPAAPYARPYEGNRVHEVALEAGLEYSAAARHQLSGALEARRVSGWAEVDELTRPLVYTHTGWLLSGYAEDEVSLSLHATLEAGTRLTYVADRQALYAEPRLALRYDGSHHAFGDYALRLAGGLYRQFVNRFELSSAGPTAIVPSTRFWLPIDRSLAPPRAYHLAAEALLKPSTPWQINLEGYYKHQPRILVVDYPALLRAEAEVPMPSSQAAFIAPSRGRAFGGGLRIRRDGARLQGALSYSYSHARRRFPGRFEDRLVPTPWNQPHRLSLRGGLRLTSSLTARLSWRGIWGRTWAFRQAYYDYLALQAAPDAYAPFELDRPSTHSLAPFYRLDAGLSYTRAWRGLSVQARTDLINVLGRRNAFDWSLRPAEEGFDKAIRTMPGRRPILSVQVAY